MKEEKEKVILDYLEDDKVAVYPYDEINGLVMNEPSEVCLRITAMEQYEIVGEMSFGNINLYENKEIEDEDFSEFSDIDEDEP